MTKVFLWPPLETVVDNHGIGRILHAQHAYLGALGIELVNDPGRAEVIACHTQQADLPRVDVLHLHGLYWTADTGSGLYDGWHHHANQKIIQAARRARVLTVPSEWVRGPFLRDMRRDPLVLPHGIDFDIWQREEPKGYVLWNKNRNRDVCDPTPAWELAMRGVPVVSTFAPEGKPPPETMRIVGTLDHTRMKRLIQSANIYLATVKETHGIGTIEAMACGVPVLGYRWGGTAEIVEHKITGYLAEPGDIEDLMVGMAWIGAAYEAMSEACREYAKSRDWKYVMGLYAALYQQTAAAQAQASTGVSVIIPNHNYGQYLQEAIESLLLQTYTVEEIIVVDDGSTDDSRSILEKYNSDRVKVLRQKNLGVAAARNRGIEASTQPFIICLDADDKLDPQYVEVLRRAMLEDEGLGVAYTGLMLLTPDGNRSLNPWPPEFSWTGQTTPHVPPSNAVPTAAMFRREMFVRAGGFRQEYAPGEDAEFFTRGLSVGFTARRVTEEGLFHYRLHEESASRTKTYVPIDAFLPWMRDRQYPMAAPVDRGVPLVRSYSAPKVSVIIPVGPGHAAHLPQALDSLLGQTFRDWEVIVVDDTQGPSLDLSHGPYPFVRRFHTEEIHGSAAARNVGLDQARAPLILFLDADDWLVPSALQEMLAAFAQAGGRYLYTDWVKLQAGKTSVESTADYNPAQMLEGLLHAMTVLISTEAVQQIRFDESLEYLEDWDFFIRCALAGFQGHRLARPLLTVRMHKDSKTYRVRKAKKFESWRSQIYERYAEYREGKKEMMPCCGGQGKAIGAAQDAGQSPSVPFDFGVMGNAETAPVVRMAYVGDQRGSVTYGGPGATPSGQRYRGGQNPLDRFINADPRDVAWLEGLGIWRRVIQAGGARSEPLSEEAFLNIVQRLA